MNTYKNNNLHTKTDMNINTNLNVDVDSDINDDSSDEFVDLTCEGEETKKLLSEIKNTYKNKQKKVRNIRYKYNTMNSSLSRRHTNKQIHVFHSDSESEYDKESDIHSLNNKNNYDYDEEDDLDLMELIEDIKTDFKNGYDFVKESIYQFSISFKADCNELYDDIKYYLKHNFDMDLDRHDENDNDDDKEHVNMNEIEINSEVIEEL